jgi:hypothetical protein
MAWRFTQLACSNMALQQGPAHRHQQLVERRCSDKPNKVLDFNLNQGPFS